MDRKKISIDYLMEKKARREYIVRTTCYDYLMAQLAEEAGAEVILVGDSMANVMFGYGTTLPMSMDLMVEHAKAVRRGAPTSFIIGDMPFMSYQPSIELAMINAGRFMAEADCDCVKVEGGMECIPVIRALVEIGIPVWGHTGLTPQSQKAMGLKTQGRSAESAAKIVRIVDAMGEAGAFAVTAEAVPVELGKVIYERAADFLVFNAGAGPYTDGPIVNMYDLLGFYDRVPRFAKKYGDIKGYILDCVKRYAEDCKTKAFPSDEYSYHMKEGEEEKLRELIYGSSAVTVI